MILKEILNVSGQSSQFSTGNKSLFLACNSDTNQKLYKVWVVSNTSFWCVKILKAQKTDNGRLQK